MNEVWCNIGHWFTKAIKEKRNIEIETKNGDKFTVIYEDGSEADGEENAILVFSKSCKECLLAYAWLNQLFKESVYPSDIVEDILGIKLKYFQKELINKTITLTKEDIEKYNILKENINDRTKP